MHEVEDEPKNCDTYKLSSDVDLDSNDEVD